MKGELPSAFASAETRLEGRAREIEEREIEENAERFARALLPYFGTQAAPPVAAEPPTGGWRPSASVMTVPSAGSGSSAVAGSAGQAADAAEQRVVMSVQAGDLGELSLVLDRTATGVRVIIGVADERAAATMAPEREALIRQLLHSGLRVESVQIIGQREVGTVLAPPRTIGTPRGPGSRELRERAEEGENEARRRGSRKLNLIG